MPIVVGSYLWVGVGGEGFEGLGEICELLVGRAEPSSDHAGEALGTASASLVVRVGREGKEDRDHRRARRALDQVEGRLVTRR